MLARQALYHLSHTSSPTQSFFKEMIDLEEIKRYVYALTQQQGLEKSTNTDFHLMCTVVYI
jgi:hypothetical protein